jgi:hypothetical protein
MTIGQCEDCDVRHPYHPHHGVLPEWMVARDMLRQVRV